jgi:hypothetical protein
MKSWGVWLIAFLSAVLACGNPGDARAATLVLSSHADTYLRDETVRGGIAFMDVRGAVLDFRGYLRFDLSALPAGATITSATLILTQVPGASRNDTITSDRFALYGLDNVAGNTPQSWDEATFVQSLKGTEDVATLTGVTDLDNNVAGISETAAGTSPLGVLTVSGAPLATFLQARFGDGALATFILSNDDATDRGYGLGTKENADPLTAPKLTIEYTAIPEPSMLALAACAALAVATRRR